MTTTGTVAPFWGFAAIKVIRMRRRDLLTFLGAATAVRPTRAQAPPKQYRIAIADPASTATAWRNLPLYRPLFPELRRLGDVEGVNLEVEYLTAEGHLDRYADLARKVVERSPDLIVSLTGDLVPELISKTRTIPIVAFMANPDFVGVVTNLARPGGNLTGVSIYAGIDIEGKRLQLLKEAVPSASRVAVLNTAAEPVYLNWRPKLREYAEKLEMSLTEVLLNDPSPQEIERGFAELNRNRPTRCCSVRSPRSARVPALSPSWWRVAACRRCIPIPYTPSTAG